LSQSTGAQTANDETDLKPVFRHKLDGSYADETQHGISGEPADENIEFTTDGTRGTVLSLSGRGTSGGYYDIPYDQLSKSITEGDPVTISVWLRPDAIDQWYTVVAGLGGAIVLRDGELRIQRYNRETRSVEYRVAVPAADYLTPNNWSHIVGTVDPGNEARLYVDGAFVAAEPIGSEQGYTPRSGLDHARVGWVPSSDDGAYDAHVSGRLSDVQFYTGSADADDVQQLSGDDTETEQDEFTATISSISTSAPITEGESLEVDVLVENTGDVGGTDTIRLESVDGTEVDSTAVSLDAGATTTVTLIWETASGDATEGEITIRSTNDVVTETIRIEPQSSSALSLSVDTPSTVEPQTSFEIQATVENPSETDKTGGVSLLFDGETVDSVDTVAAGETLMLQAVVDAGDEGENHPVSVQSQHGTESSSVSVEAENISDIVLSLDVPQEVQRGTSVTITGTAENTGDSEYTDGIRLVMDTDVLANVDTLAAEETVTLEQSFELNTGDDMVSIYLETRRNTASASVTIVDQNQDNESTEGGNSQDQSDEYTGDDTQNQEQNDENTGEDDQSQDDQGTDDTVTVEVPGFGVGESLAAVGSAGYLLKRRLSDDEK
jgi:hypothetical protein